MNETEARAWLTFELAITQLGEAPLRALFQEFGDASAIFSASADAITAASGLPLVQADTLLGLASGGALEKSWQQWQAAQQRSAVWLLPITSPHYPAQLKTIRQPPLLLHWQGKPLSPSAKIMSIVGSRACTPYGLRTVARLIEEIAATQQELVIVSGLALGVDGAAHQAALAHGLPTIGVLGSGLGHIYPKQHQGLACNMVQANGALLSEYPLQAAPTAWHFPKRNRIISGMAHAVLVVEAGARSGALITAKLAHQQKRPLWAAPGNLEQQTSQGANRLIHQGLARLALHGADLVYALDGDHPPAKSKPIQPSLLVQRHPKIATQNPIRPANPAPPNIPPTAPTPPISNPAAKVLYTLLAKQPYTPDTLANLQALSVDQVLALLLELELDGLVKRRLDGLYQRT